MRSVFTAAPSGRAEVGSADAWRNSVLRSFTTPWSWLTALDRLAHAWTWLTAPSSARRAAALEDSRALTAAACRGPGAAAADGDGDGAAGEEAAGRPAAGRF